MSSRSYARIFFLNTNVTLLVFCFNLLLVPTWLPLGLQDKFQGLAYKAFSDVAPASSPDCSFPRLPTLTPFSGLSSSQLEGIFPPPPLWDYLASLGDSFGYHNGRRVAIGT